jgi:hypothetical protein
MADTNVKIARLEYFFRLPALSAVLDMRWNEMHELILYYNRATPKSMRRFVVYNQAIRLRTEIERLETVLFGE